MMDEIDVIEDKIYQIIRRYQQIPAERLLNVATAVLGTVREPLSLTMYELALSGLLADEKIKETEVIVEGYLFGTMEKVAGYELSR